TVPGVEGRVGQFRAHAPGGEAGEREPAAGREDAVQQRQVGDPAVRRQVVEAAGVVHEVVGAGQCGRLAPGTGRADTGQGEHVPVVEAETARPTGVLRPFTGPGEGCRGEVDRVHVEAVGRQVQRVAAGSAAQFQRPAAGEEPSLDVR